MIKIENEITRNYINDKIAEIRNIGNRRQILETIDYLCLNDAELIKQALLERCSLLKKEILEQWERETTEQQQKIATQQKAIQEYEEDIKQIEGFKGFKRIKIK